MLSDHTGLRSPGKEKARIQFLLWEHNDKFTPSPEGILRQIELPLILGLMLSVLLIIM
jgi:hypothetical protein